MRLTPLGFRGPLFVLLGLSRPLYGAEDLSDLEALLDEAVVSSASLTAETARAAPATTYTINAEELRQLGIRTLDQAINYLSFGMVTEYDNAWAEIGARGVLFTGDYGSHMLVLLDGHAVNEPWDGTAYFDRSIGFPLELVDHIELILGPGSVLYGGHAMLGVIAIKTKRGKDMSGLRVGYETELPISHRGAVAFGKSFNLLGLPADVSGEIEFYRQRGPRFEYGPQDYGLDLVTGRPRQFRVNGPEDGIWGGKSTAASLGGDHPSAYLRGSWGDFEASVRAAQATRLDATSTYTNFNDPESQERDRWLALDVSYRLALTERAVFVARAYGDLYDYRQVLPSVSPENCLEGQLGGCVYRSLGWARWVGLELRATTDWLRDGRFTTLIGADGRWRDVGSRETYRDLDTNDRTTSNQYQVDEAAIAAYLQQTARLVSWLELNAGARFEWDERFGTHLSPRAAGVVEPWAGGAFKLIYAEAFRAPSAYERYLADPTMQIMATELKPEAVRSVEAVAEQRLGTHRFLVTGFYSWWSGLVRDVEISADELAAAIADGKIEPQITSANQYRNLGTLTNVGVSVAYNGSWLSRRLQLGASFTAAHTRDEEDLRLPVAASLFGNLHVLYTFAELWPTLGLAGYFAGPRLVTGSYFDPTPEVEPQVGVRGTISGDLPWLSGLSYRLVANAVVARFAPYAVGPLREPVPGYDEQELVPVDRFRVMLGLQYALPL